MSAIASVIERLEKATGPDRELDAAIAIAIFETVATDDDLIYARKRDPGEDATSPGHYFIKSRSGAQAAIAPAFTSSIDAAMTLVPEGAQWTCGYSRYVPHNASVFVEAEGRFVGECDSNRALALCIAALKARARLADGGRL